MAVVQSYIKSSHLYFLKITLFWAIVIICSHSCMVCRSFSTTFHCASLYVWIIWFWDLKWKKILWMLFFCFLDCIFPHSGLCCFQATFLECFLIFPYTRYQTCVFALPLLSERFFLRATLVDLLLMHRLACISLHSTSFCWGTQLPYIRSIGSLWAIPVSTFAHLCWDTPLGFFLGGSTGPVSELPNIAHKNLSSLYLEHWSGLLAFGLFLCSREETKARISAIFFLSSPPNERLWCFSQTCTVCLSPSSQSGGHPSTHTLATGHLHCSALITSLPQWDPAMLDHSFWVAPPPLCLLIPSLAPISDLS